MICVKSSCVRAQMVAWPDRVCGMPVCTRCFSRSAVAPVLAVAREGSAGEGKESGEKVGEGLVGLPAWEASGGGGHSWPKRVRSERQISDHDNQLL